MLQGRGVQRGTGGAVATGSDECTSTSKAAQFIGRAEKMRAPSKDIAGADQGWAEWGLGAGPECSSCRKAGPISGRRVLIWAGGGRSTTACQQAPPTGCPSHPGCPSGRLVKQYGAAGRGLEPGCLQRAADRCAPSSWPKGASTLDATTGGASTLPPTVRWRISACQQHRGQQEAGEARPAGG
jgi:hypothetical protein